MRTNLSETIKGKWEHKWEEQKSTINNLKIIYKATEKVIKVFDNYTTIISRAKYEAKQGKRAKILNPKQILQRLLIALSLVKAGKLNEWNQTILNSLYWAKEISKKVCKNAVNSIKL